MVSRNQPCLCGSGRKYKRCCLIRDRVKVQPVLPRNEIKWKKIPPNEITEADAKKVVANMRKVYKGVNLFKKESWWEKLLRVIKK